MALRQPFITNESKRESNQMMTTDYEETLHVPDEEELSDEFEVHEEIIGVNLDDNFSTSQLETSEKKKIQAFLRQEESESFSSKKKSASGKKRLVTDSENSLEDEDEHLHSIAGVEVEYESSKKALDESSHMMTIQEENSQELLQYNSPNDSVKKGGMKR